MFKYIKYLFAILFASLVFISPVLAAGKTDVYFFYGQGCPHCAKEEVFLNKLEKENQDIRVTRFEVWNNSKNRELLQRVAKALDLTISGVPVTIVGDQAIVGYYDDESTGAEIKNLIDNYQPTTGPDTVRNILNNLDAGRSGKLAGEAQTCSVNGGDCANTNPGDKTIKSFLGSINLKKLSLPILTIVIGMLDSLNPCAMWVLLFLISMMISVDQVKRRRIWILGWVFIISSAAAYFMFLSAWLNIYLFIGYVKWIKFAIALLAIGVGVYNLNEYRKNRKGGCEIETSATKRKFIIGNLKQIIQSNSFILAFAGMVILALAINMVELLCSAGLPAVYVPILTQAGLAKSQYYLYLLLYSFFYVLIQIIIFSIAMFTLKAKAVSSKFTKWSTLIGGLLMLIIGLLLLFKPAWLTFG